MKDSWYLIAGFLTIFIGISLFVNAIGAGYTLLGPLFLLGLGIILALYTYRWAGYFVLSLALISLFFTVFHINIAPIVFALLLFYARYRLLTTAGSLRTLLRLFERKDDYETGLFSKELEEFQQK